MAFPKIIHQTWKDEQVPASLAACQESWKRFNPDWEYRLWTDADNDALVLDEFPSLLDLYRSLPRPIHRADFARLLYLRRFGGLYVDLDIEALKPADSILDGRTCLLGCEPELHAQRLRGVDRVVCNAAMASEPDHPFWEKMIEEIRRRSTQGREDPVWMTGPLCLQAAFEAHADDPHAMARFNRLFHETIFRAARNRYLDAALQEIQDAIALLGTTTFAVGGRPGTAAREHTDMIAAIAARDPDRAEQAARLHIREALRARLKLLQG